MCRTELRRCLKEGFVINWFLLPQMVISGKLTAVGNRRSVAQSQSHKTGKDGDAAVIHCNSFSGEHREDLKKISQKCWRAYVFTLFSQHLNRQKTCKGHSESVHTLQSAKCSIFVLVPAKHVGKQNDKSQQQQ